MHPVSYSWHIIPYGRMISTTTDDNNGKSTILEEGDKKHYYYGYSISKQLIDTRPHIFIPRLSGFCYRPGYGSASFLGNG